MTEIIETIQRDSLISFPFLGSWTINPPSYVTVFGRTIYLYGIVIAAAFLLAIIWMTKKCKSFGIREDDLYDTIIWTIPIGIIGARLYYVLFSLEYYIANPSKIIAIWEGGLAIYGGIIAGIIVIFFLCRHKKMRVAAMLDLVIVGVIIGQMIGRWGNFFNREAFGRETGIFCRMGLTSPDGGTIYVHPTFLYESLWNFALFIFLSIFLKKNKRKYNGQIMLIYLLVYGIGRTLIEGLRTDSLYIGNSGIRVSQLLSAVLAVFAAVMLIYNARRVKNGTLKLEPAYIENLPDEGNEAESADAESTVDEDIPENGQETEAETADMKDHEKQAGDAEDK